MFTYGLLHGVRIGLLSEEEYGELADRAFQTLLDDFVTENEENGTLNFEGTVEVGSLSSNGTYEVSIISIFRGDKRTSLTGECFGSTTSASPLSRTTTEEAARFCWLRRSGSCGIRNEGDGDELRFDPGVPLVEVERQDVGKGN
jgi:hypothetical protein